jgi:copper(I)-binding protein
MKYLNRSGLFVLALLLSSAAYAVGNPADIVISAAWARATVPGQDAGSVDMTITSKRAATLVGVSSPVAKSAELHSMMNMDGMMHMREVQGIELPAGKPVNLGEKGYHVMLNDLKAPLTEGGSVPLTLSIRMDGQMLKVETSAEIRSLHVNAGQGSAGDLSY